MSLAVAGLFLQTYGAITSAQARRSESQINSYIANQNYELTQKQFGLIDKRANIANLIANKETIQIRKAGESFKSTQKAMAGISGVTSESFERVFDEASFAIEMETLASKFRGMVSVDDILSEKTGLTATASRYRQESLAQRLKGKQAGFDQLLAGLSGAIKIGQEIK